MTRPPRRSTARILVAGAVSGATMVAGTPMRRAQNATPCAMLPAEAVSTPRSRSCARGPRHDVGGAADLERADGLEVLELQPELGGRIGETAYQRRAQGHARDVGARFRHLGQRNRHLPIVHESRAKAGYNKAIPSLCDSKLACWHRAPSCWTANRATWSNSMRAGAGEARPRPGLVLPRVGGRATVGRRTGGDPTRACSASCRSACPASRTFRTGWTDRACRTPRGGGPGRRCPGGPPRMPEVSARSDIQEVFARLRQTAAAPGARAASRF